MATDAQIYDIETPFEAAIATLLTALGFTAWTRATAGKFSETPPFITVKLVLGSATGHQKALSSGRIRFDAFSGSLMLQVNSEMDETGATHRTDVAKVRGAVDSLFEDINSLLDYHVVTQVMPEGSSTTLDKEKGFEQTTLQYGVYLAIKPSVWE